jgi:hypothetical protein
LLLKNGQPDLLSFRVAIQDIEEDLTFEKDYKRNGDLLTEDLLALLA